MKPIAPLLFTAAALLASEPARSCQDLVGLESNDLEAGRSDTLVCTIVNLSTEEVSLFMEINLLRQENDPQAATSCTLQPGENCQARHKHNSPAPHKARCTASANGPEGTVRLAGNLRLDDPIGVSVASSAIASIAGAFRFCVGQ